MKASFASRKVGSLAVALAMVLWSCGQTTTPPTAGDQGSPTTSTASPVTATSPAAVAPSESSTQTTTGNTGATITETTISPTTVTAPETTAPPRPEGLVSSGGQAFPPPPSDFPEGPISEQLRADLDAFFDLLESERRIGQEELAALAAHRDIRTAWIITDILRFSNSLELYELLGSRLQDLLGDDVGIGAGLDLWKETVDLLIAWDLPAFPEYAHYKARMFTLVEPGWEPLFADSDAAIDWRWVSWGGVFLDDRPLGVTIGCPRGCIPALDDPLVTPRSPR